MTLHLDKFVEFYQDCFPNAAVPPLPTSPEDLPLTPRLTLQNYKGGMLYQNLFGRSGQGVGLPGDVQLRLNQGTLQPEDASALRAANLTYYAEQCEKAGKQREDAAMAEATARATANAEAQRRAQEAFRALPLGHPAKAPSPEAIARAKAQWKISDRPSWELNQDNG